MQSSSQRTAVQSNNSNHNLLFFRAFAALGLFLALLAPAAQSQGKPARTVAAQKAAAQQADATLDPHVRQQIEALIAEKMQRTPVQQKIDSNLLFTLKMSRHEAITAALPTLQTGLAADAQGKILVELEARLSDALRAQITAGDGEIVSAFPAQNTARVRFPLAKLELLAGRTEVHFIKPALRGRTNSISEGDKAHRAYEVRQTFGYTGYGVKVGVISDSIDTLGGLQVAGYISPVTILPGQSGIPDTGEGAAMLEVVHNLAPAASLYFATGNGGQAQMAANIRALRAAGCDIIVDALEYSDESPFQDGPIALAINEVVTGGAVYFSAAGDGGNYDAHTASVWEGDYADIGASFTYNKQVVGLVHSFNGGTYNQVTGGGELNLFWADPIGFSANDYDVYVTDSSGKVLQASNNIQNGAQTAYEHLDSVSNGSRVYIVRKATSAPRFLHLNLGRGQMYYTTPGRIQNHSATSGAIAVGAVNVHSTNNGIFETNGGAVVEAFSVDGPRRVFFNADGSPVTVGNFSSTGGYLRAKPDLVAADDVTTDVAGYAHFSGTSAAAPHAAGIAALLKSYNPALTPQQIRGALAGSALDIMAAGFDRDSGYGIAMTYESILQLAAPTPTLTSVTPTPIIAGSGSTALYVYGHYFVKGAVVLWNGAARPTAYYSDKLLRASLSAGDVASAGTASVLVANPAPGGTTLAALSVTITNNAPYITSLGPSSITAASPAFTLLVNGASFYAGSVALWNGSPRTTIYLSPTQLAVKITAADVAAAGSAAITVVNPAPGGGTSNTLNFSMTGRPSSVPIFAWGSNISGQLGNSSSGGYRPTQVAGLTGNFTAISCGVSHTLTLKTDGTVWAWGNNGSGQLGNSSIGGSTPTQVTGLSGTCKAIAAGAYHNLALKTDGTVWAWGNNGSGQLGNNGGGGSTPTQVTGLSGAFTAVAAGYSHSLAMRADGTIWAWGDNSSGQLGNNGGGGSTPTQVMGLNGTFLAIIAGYNHSLALKSDGSVWAWGNNVSGQLGNSGGSSNIPARVAGLSGTFTAITAGYYYSLALKSDGTIWGWGSNYDGQLGNPNGSSYIPTQVTGLSGTFTAIACGDTHSVALKSDGTVWAWGYNSSGELGNNGSGGFTPRQVTGLSGRYTAISGGYYHTVALLSSLPPVLLGISINPSVVASGSPVTGTVALTAAVATDTIIALSSSDTSVTVPASVVIPAGATYVTFPIQTVFAVRPVSAAITATLYGAAFSDSLLVTSSGSFGSMNSLFDVNLDGRPDLLLQNSGTGQVYYWQMNGTTIATQGFIANYNLVGWNVVGTPDLNGDGQADVILQNSGNGQVVYWLLSGKNIANQGLIVNYDVPGWNVVGTPDLNGDGKPDIVAQNQTSGQIFYWLAPTFTTKGLLYSANLPNLKVVAVADFNNDGQKDLLMQNTSDGTLVGWTLNGPSVASQNYFSLATLPNMPDWKVVGTPDLNGDNAPDILLQNKYTGQVYYYLMSSGFSIGQGYIADYTIGGWNVVATLDLNDDGKVDIVLQNQYTGQVYAWLMDGTRIDQGRYINTNPLTGWNIKDYGSGPMGWALPR